MCIRDSYYKGGVLAFNDIALLWDVNKLEDLTVDSIKPVTLYNPSIGTHAADELTTRHADYRNGEGDGARAKGRG